MTVKRKSPKLKKLKWLIKKFNATYLARRRKKRRFQNKREINGKSNNKIIVKTASNISKSLKT